MIISASRRTDIPAFHSDWFMQMVRQGHCRVPNPRYPKKSTAPIDLRPENVDIIVFWTRDPSPLLKYLPELDLMGYKYYFQYTIIGYPREIDPCCPSPGDAIATFKKLSGMIGKEKVVWRYDPILYSNITPYEWHVKQISMISDELTGHTERLVISFIDKYRKVVMRFGSGSGGKLIPDPGMFDPETYIELAGSIGGVMRDKGIRVVTCAEDMDLGRYGIERGKCIDEELIERIIGRKVTGTKDPAQRASCACVKSRDIGTNGTCRFGCKYCYATPYSV